MNGTQNDAMPFESGIKGFDPNDLYEVTVVTDLLAGEVKVLSPIAEDYMPDTSRPTRYFSTCMVAFRGQQFTCQFEIQAESLAGAIGGFKGAADLASRNLINELQSQFTKQSIMVPPGVGGPRVRPN